MKCICCKKYDDFDSADSLFYGTNTIDCKFKNLTEGDTKIGNEIVMDFQDKKPFIMAYAHVFGMLLLSEKVRIKYCPMCGRKLDESITNN